MNTQVEFRSSKFPPYEGEEEQINPGLWGKRLAEYLVEKLAAKGISTDGMMAEDWGWFVPVRNEAFPLDVSSATRSTAVSSVCVRESCAIA